jgi:prepilin-type N-terminal cleavage/methylation domain-containing protein
MIHKITSNLSRGMRHFMTGQGGFTLIELLVVVIILGVLAAVVTVNVSRFASRGEQEAQATELQNIQLAVDAYMTENRLDDLVPGTVGTNGQAPATVFSAVDLDGAGAAGTLHPQWTRTQNASAGLSYCVATGAAGAIVANEGEVFQYGAGVVAPATCP